MKFPSPHGDKLKALLNNDKLPKTDGQTIKDAIKVYEDWRKKIEDVRGEEDKIIKMLVEQLNRYRLFIDINLVFGCKNDFLYRQKGQLKLDNTVLEEFLPILIFKCLEKEFTGKNLYLGPATCFSGVRFESHITKDDDGGGMQLREKDQDFVISKNLFIKASHYDDFKKSITKKTNIAFLAAECKTNLDKTMFQEAAATAVDVKTAMPTAKYYLLCEWLDMEPISASTTAIDEVIILRKAKRITANIRKDFNTFEGRNKYCSVYEKFLKDNPFRIESFERILFHIRRILSSEKEDQVLTRGYF